VTPGPDLAAENFGTPADADCAGHGTSVASIIAAAPMAGVSFAGVAPQAAILSIKITNSEMFPNDLTPRAIRDAGSTGPGGSRTKTRPSPGQAGRADAPRGVPASGPAVELLQKPPGAEQGTRPVIPPLLSARKTGYTS